MEPTQENKNTEQPVAEKEVWHAPLNKVTMLSKITAAIVFITLPFVGFWLGTQSASPRVEYIETVMQVPEAPDHVETAETTTVPEASAVPKRGHILAISTSTVTIDFLETRTSAEEASIISESCTDKETGEVDTLCSIAVLQENVADEPRVVALVPAVTYEHNGSVSVFTTQGDMSVFVAEVTEPKGSIEGQLFEFTFNDKNELVKIKTVHQP